MFPRKLPKPQKRASRWRSQAHTKHVGEHECANCGFAPERPGRNDAAHYKKGSGCGIGQKGDDWWTVPLCRNCHDLQHNQGEVTFWNAYARVKGHDVYALLGRMIQTSPRKSEIEATMRERGVSLTSTRAASNDG